MCVPSMALPRHLLDPRLLVLDHLLVLPLQGRPVDLPVGALRRPGGVARRAVFGGLGGEGGSGGAEEGGRFGEGGGELCEEEDAGFVD
jgi:hypothetical protein